MLLFLHPSGSVDLYGLYRFCGICVSLSELQSQTVLQLLLSQLYCCGEILYCSLEPAAGSTIRETSSIVSMKEKFSVNISYSSFSFLSVTRKCFVLFPVPFLCYCQGHLQACVAAYIYTGFINCIILTRYNWKIKKLIIELRKGEWSI